MAGTSAGSGPYGTTPLPTSLDVGGGGGGNGAANAAVVWFDGGAVQDIAQQPQTTQIAVFEATPNEECINGSLLDVNQHFVVYAVKNGLIRILHRHSALRSLLRGHAGQQVTDIRFFLDGDVLGTVGATNTLQDGAGSAGAQTSSVIVWRVFEQSPEIKSEKLLEISTTSFTMSRLVWHPFNPNQFWMMHTNETEQMVATLVETTRIQTAVHATESHAVCQFHSDYLIMDGAVQLASTEATALGAGGNITDLCWSGRDTRHVLTVHDNGCILLWDLKQLDHASNQAGRGTTTPKVLCTIREDHPVSRCFFLPHENTVAQASSAPTSTSITTCFATASKQNTVITLWSSFTQDSSTPPTKLQVLSVENPSPSYVIDLCFGPAPQDASPPSCFILMADRHVGKLFAFHVQSEWNDSTSVEQKKALAIGCDYVVPFVHKHPIYSWCVVCSPTTDISEEELQEQAGLIFDMKLFAYQSKVVQCLTLTSYMCIPPEHTWSDPTPGVRVESLTVGGGDAPLSLPEPTTGPAGLMTTEDAVKDADYDEDYDVDDDDDEEAEVPDPSSLPPPDGDAGGIVGAGNAFANWLGAIAMKSSGNAPPAATPATPAMAPPPGIPGFSGTPAPAAEPQSLLSPLDILAGHSANAAVSPPQETENKPDSSAGNKKGRNKSPKPKKGRSKSPPNKTNKKDANKGKQPFPDGKISILKREEKPASSSPQRDDVGGSASPLPAASFSPPGTEQVEAVVSQVLADQLQKQEATLADLVRKTIQQELDAKLLPAIRKTMQESLDSSVTKPLQSSMDRLGKNGVQVNKADLAESLASSVEDPLKATMADAMRKVFIPAFESVTSQLLSQVVEHLPKPPPPPADPTPKLDELRAQVGSMGAAMEKMSSELEQLRKAVANQAAQAAAAAAAASHQQGNQRSPPPAGQQQVDKLEAIRHEISVLLQQRNYEAAFTKAVSASTAEMAVYCCSRADMSQVLGGATPVLSQPILLCLMQQLGSHLLNPKSDLQIELLWLQEIALVMNTSDPSIIRHVPNVLQQLVSSINNKMAEGNPQLRRPLQMLLQVIRGMQI